MAHSTGTHARPIYAQPPPLPLHRQRKKRAPAGRRFRRFLEPPAAAADDDVTDDDDYVMPPAPVDRSSGPPFPLPRDEEIEAAVNAPFTAAELERALDNTKKKSAPGADGITYQALRNLDAKHRSRLLDTYNTHWITGTLPPHLNLQLLSPILKHNKSYKQYSSYRPISLTSAASKIFEAMALARLQWFARKTGLNPEQQTGFRRQRSTTDSMADLVSALEEAKGTKTTLYLVLLDIEKAFDRLPHKTIHSALDRAGVTGNTRAYLNAFLTGRHFRVRICGVTSSARPANVGVPQGSVLSPFLFNLALADLPDCLANTPTTPLHISIYADDVRCGAAQPRGTTPAHTRSRSRH